MNKSNHFLLSFFRKTVLTIKYKNINSFPARAGSVESKVTPLPENDKLEEEALGIRNFKKGSKKEIKLKACKKPIIIRKENKNFTRNAIFRQDLKAK